MKKVIWFLLLITISFSMKIVTNIEDINQYNVDYHWDQVVELLNSVETFDINMRLTEETLHNILSLPFTNLRELSFGQVIPEKNIIFKLCSTQILTHTLIKDLFTSSYFPTLKILNLQQTNLDDRSFAFLQNYTNICSQLTNLNLGKNYISTLGFRRISKIRFQKLVNLNIMDNLLIEDQAVNAIIAIICRNNANQCPNQLESLLISETHININSFINLISLINKTTIKQLKFSGMTFKFRQTLNEGFNYSAYEYLAQQFFPVLQILYMSQQLDDFIGKIFKDWRLPNLKTLQIGSHSIGDEGVISWITKENMPNLLHLSLYQTDITDVSLEHIIRQNFSLAYLDIGGTKIFNKGIILLSQLSTERLISLSLQDVSLQSKYFHYLLTKMNLSKLQSLDLSKNNQITELFQYFPWGKFKNLKSLNINQCDLTDSYQIILSRSQVLLPSLRILGLSQNKKDPYIMAGLFIQIPKAFPNIQYLDLSQDQLIPLSYQIVQNLFSYYKNGAVINFGMVTLQKQGYKFKIKILETMFYIFSEQFLQMPVNQVIDILNNLYDFGKIQQLIFDTIGEASLFMQILAKAKINSLPKLQILIVVQQTQAQIFLALFSQIQLPLLMKIEFSLTIAGDLGITFLEQLMIPFFQKFNLLNEVMAVIHFLDNDHASTLKKFFFDNMNYSFLHTIGLKNLLMEVIEVEKFMETHGDTLRIIDVQGNFFQKDFFKLMNATQMTLVYLCLSQIFFTSNQFSYFGTVNTQFIQMLDLSETDLTNQHFFALLDVKNTKKCFPKLTSLYLNGNNIRNQGLELLMQTGLYSLRLIEMEHYKNPQFINILLRYPTKIKAIIAENVEVYSIEADLNPLSANQVQLLILYTFTFTHQDFINLGKLSFNHLKYYGVLISNVYDCQVLKDLLKINQWATFAQIKINNDNEGLNSSCLKHMKNYTSQLSSIYINDMAVTTYLPEFIELLLNTEKNIKIISLTNTRLSPAILLNIFSNKIHRIKSISLKNNYLDDSAFSWILLSSDFLSLEVLDLTGNQLTDVSIQNLSKVRMPSLLSLRLGNNNFSSKSISSLRRFFAPLLQSLILHGCQLDGLSLRLIGDLQFQYLTFLDLSFNDFDEEELVWFVENINRNKMPSLQSIDLTGVTLSKENYQRIVQLFQRKGIEQYLLSPPYNIQPINSAVY